MNTNPAVIKVLCYGDSNTWGQRPDKTGRQPVNVRWTGILQDLLGDQYSVIEEGLGGRTTNIESANKPYRNGMKYLIPCLMSHNPIDIVVVMLGTNDLKVEFNRSSQDVSEAIEEAIMDVISSYGANASGASTKIVLVSPIHINAKAPRFKEFYEGTFDSDSEKKSYELADLLIKVARQYDSLFLDASSVAEAGDDGLHLATQGHTSLAQAIQQLIK